MADDAMKQESPVALRLADNEQARRFEAHADGGDLAGYAEYLRGPEHIVFTHTVTEPRYAGRGVASRLIRFALDDSRARDLRVTPNCRFVRAYITRHPEYRDLLRGAPDEPG